MSLFLEDQKPQPQAPQPPAGAFFFFGPSVGGLFSFCISAAMSASVRLRVRFRGVKRGRQEF
jgi:hypothetical protein